jgi:hypothetical protein
MEQVRVIAMLLPDGDTERTRAQADGTYRLSGLTPGTYAVRSYVGNLRDRFLRGLALGADVEVREGETAGFDVTLSPRPTGTLQGTVSDNGKPAGRYRVRLQSEGNTSRRSETTGEDGEFGFRDLVSDRYVLTIRGPSRQSDLHRETVFVTAGTERDLSIHLATGRLRATVTAGDTQNLRGRAWILPGLTRAPDDPDLWMQAHPGSRVEIDQGSFTSGRLKPGPFLVIVDVEEHERTSVQAVVISGRDTELELLLTR